MQYMSVLQTHFQKESPWRYYVHFGLIALGKAWNRLCLQLWVKKYHHLYKDGIGIAQSTKVNMT